MTNPNDPANPVTPTNEGGQLCDTFLGFTKREYAAIKAMQGLLSSDEGYGIEAEKIARFAVEQADALIAELNK